MRAFGPLECLARLGDTEFFVRRAVGWTESHRVLPGTLVYTNNLAMVIAAADGFLALTEWSLIEPDRIIGSTRR